MKTSPLEMVLEYDPPSGAWVAVFTQEVRERLERAYPWLQRASPLVVPAVLVLGAAPALGLERLVGFFDELRHRSQRSQWVTIAIECESPVADWAGLME